MTGTTGSARLLVKADVVVPVVSPPLRAAGVVCDSTIRAIGPYEDLRAKYPDAPPIDLPDVILLPGLINAHCHLEYSELRGAIPPRQHFFQWIGEITKLRLFMTEKHFLRSLRLGVGEALAYGTTTLFDVTSSYLTRRVASETPLRLFIFYEVLGLNPFGAVKKMRRLEQAIATDHGTSVLGAGVSPHAIYSLSRRLARRVRAFADERRLPVTIHIAESSDEVRFYRQRRRIGSPVRFFDHLGLLGPRTLGIHLNVVTDEDIALCGERGISVVHCPGSHRFFRHPPFPAEKFAEAGVPLCLGTDSLASNESLDMFREMRLFAEAHPGFPAQQVLEMATTVPASFLGLSDRLGRIAPGARADLIGVRVSPRGDEDPVVALLRHEGSVAFSMIGGRVMIGPGKVLSPSG